MEANKEEIKSRLWTEWVHGLKLMGESLQKDSIDIINSGCTTVIGNENFIQKSVMYLQRKTWIGKFKDYKSRISAYEDSMRDLISQVNKVLPPEDKIVYRTTLDEIIIDGDDSFENEAWGDHAIDAFTKLCEYNNNIMDTLSKAQEALEK